MAFNFPNSPVVGEEYEPLAGIKYTWNGTVWNFTGSGDSGEGSPGVPEAPTDGELYSRRGSDSSWQVSPSGGGGSTAWDDITGKPATFPPTVPIAQADITGLTTDLAAKAPLASPIFTGDPTVPTADPTDNDLSIANTAFVQDRLTTLEGDLSSQIGTKIGDAPADGRQYGRANNDWTEVIAQSYGNYFNYMFNATVGAPPAAGTIRLNNATQTAATQIFFNYTTNDSIAVNIKTYFTNRVKVGDTIYMQDKDDPAKWQMYQVNAAFTDNTTYATIPVTWLAGGSALTAARIIVSREGASTASPIGEAPNDGKSYVRKSAAWDDFTDDMAAKANVTHTHAQSDITNLTTDLAAKVTGVNTAKITVSSTAPSSPATGDLWVDTT